MKKTIWIFLLLFIGLSSNMAFAEDVHLSWNTNTDDPAGYKVYYRNSDDVVESVDAGNATEYVLVLSKGVYYIWVTAYDAANESGVKYEIKYEVKIDSVKGLVIQ